jgi:hypothetical protein
MYIYRYSNLIKLLILVFKLIVNIFIINRNRNRN